MHRPVSKGRVCWAFLGNYHPPMIGKCFDSTAEIKWTGPGKGTRLMKEQSHPSGLQEKQFFYGLGIALFDRYRVHHLKNGMWHDVILVGEDQENDHGREQLAERVVYTFSHR